jgi:phosphoribosylamine--glycine ligase
MGTIAPNPYYTDAIAAECMEKIFLPTVRAMNAEGRPFRGCLYFGLMLTADGPKVIEYNCRFGDPETQVVLPLLESDLFEIMLAVTNGHWRTPTCVSGRAACCVVLASEGYPTKYEKGFPITLPETGAGEEIYVGARRSPTAFSKPAAGGCWAPWPPARPRRGCSPRLRSCRPDSF